MQQVKIFSGLEDQTLELESQINDWLKESNAKVVQIFGNIAPQSLIKQPDPTAAGIGGGRRFAPSDVMIVVLYEA